MRKSAVRTRVVVSLIMLFYLAVVIAVAYLSTARGKRLAIGEVEARLRSAAASLEYILAEDFHDRAVDATSIGAEEDELNHLRLSDFVAESKVGRVYTLVKRDGNFHFTSISGKAGSDGGQGPGFFSPYADAPAAFHRTFATGELAYTEHRAGRGVFMSIALQRRSPGGRTYLACADIPMSDLRGIGRSQALWSAFVSIILFLGFLPLIFWYRREWARHRRSLICMNERLQDAAQASEERFRRLFEHSADAVVALNAWELTEYVNPSFCALFGWRREELVGKELPIVPTEKKSEAASLAAALRDRAEAYRDLETRRIAKNGTVLDVAISGAPLADGRGGFAGSLLLIRDRTERRKLEVRLARAERLRAVSALAAGAAHDFNNALMVIQGNVSLLSLEGELGAREREIVKDVEVALRSAMALTRELLDFAHLDDTELEPTDVGEVAARTVEAYCGPRPALRVEVDLGGGPHMALAKAQRLERVLVNLLVNADQAMSGTGPLCVTADRVEVGSEAAKGLGVPEGAFEVLRISDAGCGMSDEVRNHLFEPLFTTKKHGVGTGLGLATAYAAIRSFGGTIEVESEPGRGSTFSLYLPAC